MEAAAIVLVALSGCCWIRSSAMVPPRRNGMDNICGLLIVAVIIVGAAFIATRVFIDYLEHRKDRYD